MKINKQLFEDVLSGKLKGIFVLRNVHNIYGVELKPNHTCIQKSKEGFYIIRMPSLLFNVVDIDGKSVYACTKHKKESENNQNYDIIDFIPETNMKENELTIEIPDRKIVDWDESKKQNKIVLKDKQLTYNDICEKLFKDKKIFYLEANGDIESATYSEIENCIYDKNNATSKHQLECIRAKNQLANVAVCLNGGWKPSYNSSGINYDAWVLYLTPKKDYIGILNISNCSQNSNVFFKSEEIAQQAIEILGEELIKLALEPLGI